MSKQSEDPTETGQTCCCGRGETYPKEVSFVTLNEKYHNIKSHLRGYQVELQGLSIDDM